MSMDYELYKEGGILNDRYQKIDDISEGSYGYVSLAKDLKFKKLVAIKYIFKLDSDNYSDNENENESSEKKRELDNELIAKKSLISDAVKSRFSNNVCFEAMYEVDIQTKVGKHKNIAELLDFFDSYIVMEYCTGGDLYEAIKDDIVPRRTKSITYIISQIMDAIEYVHAKGIYHRDIKPENILITGIDWTIKLTDWGLATTDKVSMDRSVGSERYMSPELFESNLDIKERREPYDCSKVDLWAMGIVFLNIVFHKNPFSIADQTDKSFCYFAANREALFDVFSSMTYDFFQVLRYCLTIDPTNRDLDKMREELNNLVEYTFDDEYYNTLEDEYDIPMSSETSSISKVNGSETSSITPPSSEPSKMVMPPSSAPVALPTPINSSKPIPHIKNDDFEIKKESSTSTTGTVHTTKSAHHEFKKPYDIPKFKISPQNHPSTTHNDMNNHYNNNNNNNNSKYHSHDYYNYNKENPMDHRERAKSVPKIKFNRRPRVKNSHNNNNQYYGNSPNSNHNNNYGKNNHYKAFRMRRRNKSKIIKNSRKPLGIPTPNTHINNYIHDFKAKEDNQNFNTRDFFTPPSVQHRYMEGIFDNKNRYHKQQYKNNYLNVHNNKNNSSHDSNNNYSKSWNNNNNISNKSSKFRRPSTTGNQAFGNTYYSGNRSRHSFHTSNIPSGTMFKRSTVQHSPGSYIPPNARGNYPTSTSVGMYSSSHIPNISSVLGDSDNENLSDERGRNVPISSALNSAIDDDDGEHDLDDTLFSLDDGDHDYINGMNNLSLDGGMSQQNNNGPRLDKSRNNGSMFGPMDNLHVNTSTNHPQHDNNNDLPDLLKSPVMSSTSLNTQQGFNGKPITHNHYLNIPPNAAHHHAPTNGVKSDVYVPPHHRRSSGYSTNEAVLSVSPNSISIQKNEPISRSFKKPIMPMANSGTTVALQDQDVFRYADNDALIFEDDEDDNVQDKYLNQQNSGRGRRSFGPYQIYDDDDEKNTRLNAYRSNRRTSSIQNEAVGSLEQYKNNWLMLQQPQE